MTPPIPSLIFLWALLGLLALGVGGCGLGDYEAHMIDQQRRLDRLDRENKELGGSLEIPKAVQKYAEEMFLHVPKGVSTAAETANLWSGLYYKYAGGGSFAGLYNWPGQGAEDKNFAAKAHGAGAFNDAKIKHSQYTTDPAGTSAPDAERDHLRTGRQHLLSLSESEREGGDSLRDRPEGLGQTTTDTMNLSLSTLAFGSDALKRRKEYDKQTKGTKK